MAIPAEIEAPIVADMRRYAEQAFRAIGACGLSRCDFFLTEDGKIYLNELNTMPDLLSGLCTHYYGKIWG